MKKYITTFSTLFFVVTIFIATVATKIVPNVQVEDELQTRACCKISSRACAPTPITSITTISTPGTYCLANDLSGTTTLITISSSSVVLDLNGHILNAQGGANGIGFDGVFGRSDVTIKNGTIDGTGGGFDGIFLATPLSGATPGDLNEQNIILTDLLIKNFSDAGIVTSNHTSYLLSDTATPYYPLSAVTIDNCTLASNEGSLGLYGAQDVIIKNSKFSGMNLIGSILENCFNVLIQNSFFDKNGYGLVALNVSEMLIENSFFNFNTLGLMISGGSNITVNGCSCNENTLVGFLEGILFSGSQPPSGISFLNCSFNQNALFAFIVSSVVGAKVSGCQANSSGYGFILFDTATDIGFENCEAVGNEESGFLTISSVGSNISCNGCLSKDNHAIGFDLSASSGSGVIQACKAIGNSFCGFNDKSGTLYQYLSNVAQNNGPGAAQSFDSNYCIGSGPTEYTPITGGPGVSKPFSQLGRSTATNVFNAGITSWDNVTLP